MGELLLGAALKAFFGALFDQLFGWLDRRQALDDARQAGAAETTAKINKEAADAERRAASVPDGTRDSAADDLEAGRF